MAITAQASLLVSRDRDLLDLMDTTTELSRSFRANYPQVQVVDPVEFLRLVRAELPK